MSRFTLFVFFQVLLGLCRLAAQQSPAADQALREAAAAIEAPAAPNSGGTVVPVAPPLPGQLKAEPAAAPSRIPDLPTPETTVVPSTVLNKNKVVSSTSSSGQFIVHGNDLSLRSAFSSRCEEISTELRNLLHDRDPWMLPIVVLLNSGDAAKKADKAASMEVSQITHGGFHLQVSVNLRADLRPTDVRAEIIRVLLAERILRNQKELTSKRAMLLPDWLFTGIIEALDYRKRTRPSALFAAIFKSGKIYGIEEIIEASPVQMDGLSKTIYQTSCCALVLALLDQPESGKRLNNFLASLSSDPRPERELLNLSFPSFATTPASLNKWWSLQLASLSTPSVSEPLSAADTLKVLEEALTLRYQAKQSDIPKPRPVIAIIAPKPIVEEENKPRSTLVDNKTPTPAETDTAEPTEEKKRSLFSRLNPFGRRKASNDEVISAAIEAAAQDEAKEIVAKNQAESAEASTKLQEVKVASTNSEKRKVVSGKREPLFNRWFGEKTKPAAIQEAAVPVGGSPSSEAAGKVPAEEKQIEKRPSMLNPLNWFRKSQGKDEGKQKSTSEESPTIAPPVQSNPQTTTAAFRDWLEPSTTLIAYAYQETVAEEPAKEKKGFRGLFGGKKKTEEKPAAEETVKEEKKEEKPKPQPKEETKAEKPSPKPEPQAKASKPKTEAESKTEEKPTAPMPPASAPVVEKPKREPIRIRSLFGPGKKKEEAEKSAETAVIPSAESIPPMAKGESKALTTVPGSEEKSKPELKEEAKVKAPVTDSKLEAKETKPNREVESKAGPETNLPMPAEVAPAASEPKREPFRLRSLFGSGKKKEDAKSESEKTSEPIVIPAAEALPLMTQEQIPASKPEVEKEEEAKVVKSKKPKAKLPPAPQDEPLVAAIVSIDNYTAIMKRKDRKDILQHNLVALNALQQRCAVLFRPIVADYTSLIIELSDGKEKNVDERLKKLRTQSQAALTQSKAVRDFLDLSEANSSSAMSGLFEDYIKLPETIEKELPQRTDPISKYLDALDREFSKP